MVNINFSWDDGSIQDIKIAEMFNKYCVKSIFYIPSTNHERKFIGKNQINIINDLGMLIGGHTKTHRYLNTIPKDEVQEEVVSNKIYLENTIAKKIDSFCYPGGRTNSYIEKIVKKNFKKARTAKTLCFNEKNENFNINPTFHFYDRGKKSILKNVIQNNIEFLPLCLKYIEKDYFTFIKKIIMELHERESVYNINIWGHGWEIQNENLWSELNDFMKFITSNSFNYQKI